MFALLIRLRGRLLLGAPLILLAFFDLFFFGRPMLMGQSVSNLPILADWDYFWNSARTTSFFVYAYDPSLYWFTEPLRRLGRELLLTGQNPFWCPNSGCGFPLFCDPESRVLSPINWLFPSNGYFYTASIVAKFLLGQYGVFKLARQLQLNELSSVFAAILYSFCPFIVWQSELSFENWQSPWIILTFLLATKKLEVVRIVLLASVCAFSVLTMHKECSFNAISAAVVFSLMRGALEHRLLISVRIVGAAALLAVALAAPLLFAYFELILNSHCAIRANMTALQAVPFKSIVACLFYPIAGPASSFFGFMSAILMVLPTWKPNRTEFCLLISGLVAIVLCTLPWPVSQIFLIRPLNYLEPLYFSQSLVLFLSLLAACGFERLREISGRRLSLFAVATLAVCLLAYYFLTFAGLDLSGCTWHGSMLPPLVVPLVAQRSLWLSLLFALECFVLAMVNLDQLTLKKIVSYSLISLTFLSLWFVSRASIPHQSKTFEYPVTDCTEFLRKSKSRIVAVGRRFLPANVPALYGIRDLRLGAQLEPNGLNEFLAACRSTMSEETAFPFQDVLSSFVNFASVSLAVSRAPVVFDSELRQIASRSNTTILNLPFQGGARLTEYAVVHDVRNRQVIGVTRWLAPERDIQFYTVQAAVLSSAGAVLWEGQELRLSEFRRVGLLKHVEVPYLLPLPRGCTSIADLSAVVRLKNRLTGAAEWPTVVGGRVGGPQVQLETRPISAVQSLPLYSSMNFVFESEKGVRVYRNDEALSECYFVRDSCSSRDIGNAVSKLRALPSLARSKVVLISASPGRNQIEVAPAAVLPTYRALSLNRQSNVRLSVAIDAPTDGWVVLTDTFYPGWHAYLDSKEVVIHRANVLFRAVAVTKGRHTLVYKYRPDSLLIGLVLQFVALAICIFILVRKRIQMREHA